MNIDHATVIALEALEHLAADDVLLRRFMAESGLDQATLGAEAANPAFLAGVLDFLLADETALTAFCEAAALEPELPMRARLLLPGGMWTD